jgi:formylglycine-generating enzyme required for sulfatase activity
LSAAIDLFATENPAEVRPDLLERISDALQKHFAFEHELLPDLQRHFSEPLIDWIAACALWPTLHWDLTLHLGKIVGERSNQNLLDFSGIRELTRLPWFVEGRIPDAARIILVAYLQRRGLEIPLREAIRALLHHTQPPGTDTLAYDAYRMNVIVNELSLRPNAAKRRVLEREFERYLQAKKQIDVVAIKLLYRPITPLDVLLSERMKKYAFREGYRALGWRLAPQLLASWLLLGIGVAVFPLPQKPCDGKLVNYQNQSYCLSTPRDQLLHLEQLAADAIRAQQPLKVKSLVAAADLIKTQDTAFYENTAARYYNQGAQLYNCSRTPTAGCSPLPADSLRTLACGDFLRGDSLYTRLLGRPGPQFFAAQQRSCPQAINPNTGRPNTTQTPAAFDLRGTVLDALTQKPIAGALIQLAGLKTRSNGRGQYQFQLPSGAARTSLNLQASAKDYDPLQLRTAALPTLPKLRLTPSSSSLEAIAWEKALKVDRPEGYTIYLADFPTGAHAAEARQRISAATSVREQAAWGAAQKTDSSDGYTTYLADFPTGAHAAEARQRISAAASAREQAAWPTAQKTNTLAGYQAFLSAYPQGAYAAEAQNRLEQLRDDAAWEKAQTAQTPAACQQYLQQYPQGRHAAEARTCADPRPQTGTTDIPKPNLVRIPGGSFQMGDVMEDKESSDELPVHTVSLDAFELGRYEVTFAEYDRYCEATKKEKPADKGWGRGSHPIINVSWGDAIAYCNWLSTQHGYQQVYVTGKGTEVQVNAKANGYRLPSEAEWEYAARGRSKKVRFGNGKDIADPKEINFEGSKEYKKSYSVVGENRQQTVPVGSLNSPNALGLHDMSGNVYEWCWDWYGDTYYKSNPARNPQGPGTGSDRVLRGGSCYNYPQFARVALRGSLTPDSRYGSIGFRLARTP